MFSKSYNVSDGNISTSKSSSEVLHKKFALLNEIGNNDNKCKMRNNAKIENENSSNSKISKSNSLDSLASSNNNNVTYRTSLRIDEDEQSANLQKYDDIDGVASSKYESLIDEDFETRSKNFSEEEDTQSLLCDSEVKNNLPLKRGSMCSIYDDHKLHYHLMDAVEKKLSLTQDATEKIVHKILDNHYERYEEIPKEDKAVINKIPHIKSKRVVKNGCVLSTANATNRHDKKRSRCCCCCGIKAKLIWGIICLLIGILTTIWTPSEFLIRERLRMTPGLPAFDWWAKPPDDIYLRVYLFNYTNYKEFLAGEDDKFVLKELGPVVFKEKLEHSNFTFNDNDTLTYQAHRWVEFLPELNTHIDMNATIFVPNLPILGIASFLHDSNFLVKGGFNIYTRSKGSEMIVNITVYDYLFNFKDPILETAKSLVPQIVPISNMGMLSTMYMQAKDTVTVYIGPKWGDEKFFTIDHFNGETKLPGFLYTPSCKESVVGSTEGILYRQRSPKNTTLLYWRKTLCKVMKLTYEDELVYNGVQAYKFSLPLTAYHRTYDRNNPDCFAGEPPLPNGLSDISKCFFNFPMALSLPHFLGTDPKAMGHIQGLEPDVALHNSYLILEPLAGIPIVSVARSQINLVIRNLENFNTNIQKFSDKTIPMFWAEYSQLVLPDYVWALMFIQLKYVPVIQVILSVFLIVLGTYLVYVFLKTKVKPLCCPESFKQHKNINNLARNALVSYETEQKQVSISKKV